jgi:3-hydroxyacyl-[acyl-carrier-protein] dehydratase
MRWIWVDRIIELERASRCVSIKNISMAEDVLHDHFPATDDHPAMPVLPNPLIVEGMAQTAGILVGHANDFKEKVILAKIGRAKFSRPALPGFTLRYTAVIDRMDDAGASTSGTVDLINPVTSEVQSLGEIQLLFSHIDQNRSGLAFPEHNFVFTDQFMDLLRMSGFAHEEN